MSVAHIADVIIVLHNGEIIEQGTPKELLMSGGAFRYLATLQVIDISAWARNGHMHGTKILYWLANDAVGVAWVAGRFWLGAQTREGGGNDATQATVGQEKQRDYITFLCKVPLHYLPASKVVFVPCDRFIQGPVSLRYYWPASA